RRAVHPPVRHLMSDGSRAGRYAALQLRNSRQLAPRGARYPDRNRRLAGRARRGFRQGARLSNPPPKPRPQTEMNGIHPSETDVNAATEQLLKAGIRIFQGVRLGPAPEGHVHKLLRLMDPPANACIADMGCCIGELARLI